MSEHVSSTLKVKDILSKFPKRTSLLLLLGGRMNHPSSQSRGSKRKYLHPTTGRPPFWGTEYCTYWIIPSLLLLPEEAKSKPCQKALQRSTRFVRGLQKRKVEWQQIKVLSLVTALLITAGCWSTLLDTCPALVRLELTFCHWAWLSRASGSLRLLDLFPNYTLSL